MNPRNRYLEAIKENYNVVGLTGALALSAALLNPLPLLAGIVAEALYLVFVPDSKWYESRLSSRHNAEVAQRRAALKARILPTLRPVLHARFMRLEKLHHDIAAQQVEESEWFQEIIRKLDYLLEKFLQFAARDAQFRQYLTEARDEAQNATRHNQRPSTFKGQANPAPAQPATPNIGDPEDRWVAQTVTTVQQYYDQELETVQNSLNTQDDAGTRSIIGKRLEVLKRRREFIGKIGRIQMDLNHQLQLLEDTFGLISDELRARPAEQVLSDIDDVVSQTNTMTAVLEAMPSFDTPPPEPPLDKAAA